jgi:uncharacterized protein (DUF2147 family)
MKKLYILAALLMATTSAHAGNGISFQINGERIRVEAPRNCNALSCIRITAPGYSGTVGNIDLKGIGSKSKDDDDFADTTPAKSAPAPAPAPVQAAAPQPAAPAATYAPAPAPTTVASTAPVQADVAAPAPAPVAPAAPVAQPAPVAAAPVSDPNSPLGVWATEENKGNVRIEQCGSNLCGYAVKSGEKILISMKPEGGKWTGRIHDPDSGRNYDSTMAMKGSTTLRVQGCAFGGMFCGGQTWKRVS